MAVFDFEAGLRTFGMKTAINSKSTITTSYMVTPRGIEFRETDRYSIIGDDYFNILVISKSDIISEVYKISC